MNTIVCYDLGRAPYRETWELQAAIQKRLIEEKLQRNAKANALQQVNKDGLDVNTDEGIDITPNGTTSSDADTGAEPVGLKSSSTVADTHSIARSGNTASADANVGDASPEKTTSKPEEAFTSHDVLLFVEHPHVYTLGKSGDAANLLKNDAELADLEATYVKIDRGGDITYHGPGQIVGYPILDLDRYFTDIHKYLRLLEETIIRVCADYGITAGRIDKLTGVWVGDAKICAFGIKCSRWVTMHGFALNVNTKLDYFGHIVPCGITNKAVTSLSELLGRQIDEHEVKENILHHFGDVFGATIKRLPGLPPEAASMNGLPQSTVNLNHSPGQA
ncbi:MAG: lipoyl(octanoyl) transferase LipB [Bacteroidetes bacterium]|nr:lipoyl(octanoyl) transferase LipB [Bacteroidota bacterium]MCH8523669.1 lipoyl(octanoyl) transferase LipB [Balneolales bacterium]